MVEVLTFIWNHRNEPLGWLFLGSFLVLLDRLGRKFVTSQLKRLFGVDHKDEFRDIAKAQQRMESKIDFLIKAGGHQWAVESAYTSEQNAYTGQRASLLQRVGNSLVRIAASFTALWETVLSRLKGVGKMSKAWIVGLLGYLAYFIKQFTGYDIPDEMVDKAADLVLLILVLIPMIKNMKRGDSTNEKHFGDHGSAL